MNQDQIAALKAAAEKATPGQWWHGNCEPADGYAVAWLGNCFVDCEGGVKNHVSPESDAEFIAQANPAIILTLLAEMDALIARAEAAEQNSKRWVWFVEKLTSQEGCSVIEEMMYSLEVQDFITPEQFTAAIDAAMQQEDGE